MGNNRFGKSVVGGYRIQEVDQFIVAQQELQRKERVENKERLMRLRATNVYLQEKLEEVRGELARLQERVQPRLDAGSDVRAPQSAVPIESPKEDMDAELQQQAAAFYRQMNLWQNELGNARHEITTIRRVSQTMTESLDGKLANIQRDMIAEGDAESEQPPAQEAPQEREAPEVQRVPIMSDEEESQLKTLYRELRDMWNEPGESQ